ncbi:MAG: neutral/alkaline non-lysosomal ceramidase N-terminal domain-containing protein [Bryobacteraceae bacterium]
MITVKLLILLLVSSQLFAAGLRAGTARADLTPDGPVWMSGYASRKKPSEGVFQKLWAKALAVDDGRSRVVIVTTDLIGLPRQVSEVAAARIQKDFGLQRSAILFNSSHTHTGPLVWPNLHIMLDPTPEDEKQLQAYAQHVTDALVTVAGAALGALEPADLAIGHGSAGFAMNRREPTPKGVKIGLNPQGPVDHDVPVLRVTSKDGKLLAVLFGYACHNTTLTGEHYQLSGDYAGQAQAFVEEKHPGANALFLMLCGGDQNPNPRTKIENVIAHGHELSDAVDGVLKGAMKPLRAPLRSSFRTVEPAFAPHDRATFEEEAKNADRFRVKRAQAMLAAYDNRTPPRRLSYPIQAIRFGKDLTIVALGGEVVVDYGLRLKRQYGTDKEDLIVAGYSNDVMCYIPTKRILGEGGYEAVESMIYYGQPGPFSDDVEETIIDGVKSVMGRVGRKSK